MLKRLFAAVLLAIFPAAGLAAGLEIPSYLPLPAGFAGTSYEIVHDFDFSTFTVDVPASGSKPARKEDVRVEGRYIQFRIAHAGAGSGGSAEVCGLFRTSLTNARWQILRTFQGSDCSVTARRDQAPKEVWLEVHAWGAGEALITLVEKKGLESKLTLEPPAAKPETFGDADDAPYLKRMSGWTLTRTERMDGPLEVEVDSAPAGARMQAVDGTILEKTYAGGEKLPAHEPYAIYREALAKAGWTVTHTFEGTDRAIVGHFTKSGRDVWAELHFWNGGRVRFRIVDAGSATKASHLKDELTAKGRVALYGIHFDTDSAKLRPDSDPVLKEILALLTSSPELKLEIQGHTDNTGTRQHNQTLSGQRAASVKTYLTGRGIAVGRLSTAGFADTVPVGDNATAEGRAKNRRVELVRK